MSFVIHSCKTGKCWTQNVFTYLQNFAQVCNPLICDPTLFPGKNSPNIAKSNRVSPGKGRGDRTWILTYLDSSRAEVLPHICLSFSILVIFRWKPVVQVRPKVQTLGPSLFHKNSSHLNENFKNSFLLVHGVAI